MTTYVVPAPLHKRIRLADVPSKYLVVAYCPGIENTPPWKVRTFFHTLPGFGVRDPQLVQAMRVAKETADLLPTGGCCEVWATTPKVDEWLWPWERRLTNAANERALDGVIRTLDLRIDEIRFMPRRVEGTSELPHSRCLVRFAPAEKCRRVRLAIAYPKAHWACPDELLRDLGISLDFA